MLLPSPQIAADIVPNLDPNISWHWPKCVLKKKNKTKKSELWNLTTIPRTAKAELIAVKNNWNIAQEEQSNYQKTENNQKTIKKIPRQYQDSRRYVSWVEMPSPNNSWHCTKSCPKHQLILTKTRLAFLNTKKSFLNPGLRNLFLGGNQLMEIPSEIKAFKHLKVLYLGGNLLTELPSAICQLKKIRALVLCQNRLRSLPNCICKLQSLECLQLHQVRSLEIQCLN